MRRVRRPQPRTSLRAFPSRPHQGGHGRPHFPSLQRMRSARVLACGPGACVYTTGVRRNVPASQKRAAGFEPATFALARRCSTTELHTQRPVPVREALTPRPPLVSEPGRYSRSRNPLKHTAGHDPATSCLEDRRSAHLSYVCGATPFRSPCASRTPLHSGVRLGKHARKDSNPELRVWSPMCWPVTTTDA